MMFIVVIGLVAVVDDVFDPLWLSLQIYAIIPTRQKRSCFKVQNTYKIPIIAK